ALGRARQRAFKGVVALDGDAAMGLARELKPDAVLLSLDLHGTDGLTILRQLKRHPDTRHVPVHVVGHPDMRQQALAAGAVGHLEAPAGEEQLDEAFAAMAEFIDRRVRRLLLVEDDETERRSVAELIGTGDDVEITAVGSSEEALAELERQRFDCMVLDLKLPEMGGFALLERLKDDKRFCDLPVIVHTGKQLTRKEETRLRKYAETIVVKDAGSPERLLDETALFLHRPEASLPAEKRKMLERLHNADAVFQGRKVLVVDDDVRNLFALASALEARGMQVVFAENGREGIEALRANPDVDLALMDVMMPEMDGYETIRAVRAMPEHERLPIISLTAKAMKGDREKSIAAGASDYITKPVDIEQLLSLMRVWLYQ
nr:response regulator [Actinomycetota bacterium]